MLSNKNIKKLRKIFHKYPWLYDLASSMFLNYYYRVERDLIKGKHNNKNKNQSIIHFSHNKSASMHVKRILAEIANYNGMTTVNLSDYSFNSNLPYIGSEGADSKELMRNIFKSKGYLYSAFGSPQPKIDDIDDFKVIYMMRDPRDILVSDYYSKRDVHLLPPKTNETGSKKFKEYRKEMQTTDINDFVIDQSDYVFNKFYSYKEFMNSINGKKLITKFELMVDDYENWLYQLVSFTELNIPPGLIDRLLSENENKKIGNTNYVRSGKSGDYKSELKKETIDLLNNKFKDVLNNNDYKIND